MHCALVRDPCRPSARIWSAALSAASNIAIPSPQTADLGALGRVVLGLTRPALSLGEPVREHRRDDLRRAQAEAPAHNNQGREPALT
jgi:hypothetical protein